MILQTGVVIRDANVEKTTHFVAKTESPSYLDASILVVAPAGIAAKITLTPVTRGSNSKILHGMYTTKGITTSLITEK